MNRPLRPIKSTAVELPAPVGQDNLAAIRAARRRMLQAHGYKGYADYLASPRWQMIRAVYWMHPETAKSCICGEDNPRRLHLHHRTYTRVGSEDLTDLRPLCATCHRDVHLAAERGLAPYDLTDYADEERRRRYAAERQRERTRRGEGPDLEPQTPYAERAWHRSARVRHADAQDRRERARRLRRA